jgi:hypothetical protein
VLLIETNDRTSGLLRYLTGMILTWVRRAEPGSDAEGELVEGGADPVSWRLFGNDLVAFAAQVLNQRGTCRDDPSRPQSLESAHRSRPGFEPSVIGSRHLFARRAD